MSAGVAQDLIECLPSMYVALCSNPSTAINLKKQF
jgi:hypothetical protein